MATAESIFPESSGRSGDGDGPLPEYVRDLERRLAEFLPAEQIARVRHAYRIAAAAHAGQTRQSGEPYITHPVAVAAILAEFRLDAEALCAAILHDALEDTRLSRAVIEREFGSDAAALVEGVTKLDKLRFGSRQEATAESFRKMMLAMARDLRVILIKLADRLHNMRTLSAKDDASRRRIAAETLDIYAPIAQRLGMNKLKAELQDLGFRALYPRRYAVIAKRIRSQPVVRRQALKSIEAQIAQRLSQEAIPFRLVGRVKSPWSIFTKMRAETKSFEQVMDVFGFRVVVGNATQCYHALGVVHSIFKPVHGRFRDFIAIPKANGYQSLHTVLFGPYDAPIEVQIRTEEMDLIAERGVAAHWSYKTGEDGGNNAQTRAQNWIRGLLESQQAAGSSLEFVENVKVDLFPDEVYVFTPRGDILALPRNATVLDFAYTVHTDVGNHAVTSRVDGRLLPLRTRLESGQTVEVVTAPSAAPDPHWLEFVVTSKARTAIRHYLKRIEHEDAVELGHRMLDRALEALDWTLERVPERRLNRFLAQNRYRRLEEMLADIALGNLMPARVAKTLSRSRREAAQSPGDASEKILITGAERGVLTFAACCRPIPGDEIMGYLSAGKGVVVHRIECRNVTEYRRSPERWVDIAWDRNVQGDYLSALRIQVQNKPGVLAQVAAAVGAAHSNIESVEYRERDFGVAAMQFVVEVADRRHLAEVIRRVRRLSVVSGVQRV